MKDHQDLIDDAIYPELLAGLKPCVGPDGKPDLTHVHYEPAAGIAGILNAPVTSLALVTKLNPEHSAAVHADADQVVYTEAEEKKVRRKIDRVVLPLIVCSYICKISPNLWESCR